MEESGIDVSGVTQDSMAAERAEGEATTIEADSTSEENNADEAFVQLPTEGLSEPVVKVSVANLSPPALGETLIVERQGGARSLLGLSRATLKALDAMQADEASPPDTVRLATESAALLRFALRERLRTRVELSCSEEGEMADAQLSMSLSQAGASAVNRLRLQRRMLQRELHSSDTKAARVRAELAEEANALRECLISALPVAARSEARHVSNSALPAFVAAWKQEHKLRIRQAEVETEAAQAATLQRAGSLRSRRPQTAIQNAQDPRTPPGEAMTPRGKDSSFNGKAIAQGLPVRPGSAPPRSGSPLAYAGQRYDAYTLRTGKLKQLDHTQQELSVDRMHYTESTQRKVRTERRRDMCHRAGLQWGNGVLTSDQQEELGDRLCRRQLVQKQQTMESLTKKYAMQPVGGAVLTQMEISMSASRLHTQEERKRQETRDRLKLKYVDRRLPKKKTITSEQVRNMADRLCPVMAVAR
eukprot:Hpha_TRINITY_DN15855_c1_g1::TRINITY_DN15855_c1_g1_i1::g.188104::m.188104